jgi:carboxylesterase type B
MACGHYNGTTATPNAGLYDQHLALQWVQDHLPSIGGNKSMVTAVGQSAGASSLLHHLILEGGALNPLFNQVVLLSPAFIPLYDRKGDLEETFQSFSAEVSKNNTCKVPSIDCLRTADEAVIVAANKKIIDERQKESFIFGPVADGRLIRQLPALEFTTDKTFRKKIPCRCVC